LILCGPGAVKGIRSKQTFRHVDILPTLLSYLNLSADIDGDFEGQNLLEAWQVGQLVMSLRFMLKPYYPL
jgi:arylsulfatase A-like enzyme